MQYIILLNYNSKFTYYNMSLKLVSNAENIRFRNINDNYSRIKYLDFNVIVMNKNGYINCTKMCDDIAEEIDSTKTFKQWENRIGSDELIHDVGSNSLIRKESGIFCHPELALVIAGWMSPNFQIKLSKIITRYVVEFMKNETEKLLLKKDNEIKKLNKMPIIITNQNECVFYLLANNDKLKKNKTNFAYGVIRVANKSAKVSLAKYKENHPNMKVIKPYPTSNPKKLWQLLRNNLEIRNKITVDRYQFNVCKGYSIEQVITHIIKIKKRII